MKLCAIGLHKWSNWKLIQRRIVQPVRVRDNMTYKGPATIEYKEDWQRRVCANCGKIQMAALP